VVLPLQSSLSVWPESYPFFCFDSFSEPLLKTLPLMLSQRSDFYEVWFSTAYWFLKGSWFGICLVPDRLRFHGLVTVLTFCLNKNLGVLFHTPTLVRFPLWSFSLFEGTLFLQITSSSHYVNLKTVTRPVKAGLRKGPAFRVLPSKESVRVWQDFTPVKQPLLFWGYPF
jgi:hypothetical protein